MKTFIPLAWALLLSGAAGQCESGGSGDGKPNILVVLVDDLGYADVGFQGAKDIPTPNLDRLARRSVRCTNGYVPHSFCSPTRAGLLAGRYQQRFGHENNPRWLPSDPTVGLPVSEPTLPEALKSAGYATGAVGKWHLGAHASFHPNRRGFDEYFGVLGGGHVYFPGATGGKEYTTPLDRNGTPEAHADHLTEAFTREAIAYIDRHKTEPWFLYLAYNAPHRPLQAPEKHLERVKHIVDETRRAYAALVVGVDEGVGAVLDTLQTLDLEKNTLIFFMSDNGGPAVTRSDNGPLRGTKGSVYEGGIRVPFLVSWPRQLPEGSDYAEPVNALDVYATAVAVAEANPAPGREGVNLLPYLVREKAANSHLTRKRWGSPHERMFWRQHGGETWAVREDRWKLVNGNELYDLAADISESNNLASEHPDVVMRLEAAYKAWNAGNIPPLWESPRR